MPYRRDEKLARPWVVPGTPGLEHRIGGLEKDSLTGNISYDAQNHEKMVRTRAEKVRRIADRLAPIEPYFDPEGDVLVTRLGGHLRRHHPGRSRCTTDRPAGRARAPEHIMPLPNDLTDVVARYDRWLIPS